MNKPLISVILPVYNGERFLKEAIESILQQTYVNLELIIVNDASTDDTLSIAEKFRTTDKRVRILSNPVNYLLPKSLNVGHREARGELLTWTSDDNILKPYFLQSLQEFLYKEKGDLIFSDHDVVWQNGEYKRRNYTGPLADLLFGNVIGASFLYKKEVFEGIYGFNEELFLVEDYHFFLKAALKFKFIHLRESLYLYRIHDNSLTKSISTEKSIKENYSKTLLKAYLNIGEELNWNPETSKLLVDLFFRKKIDIKDFVRKKGIYQMDLQKYFSVLKMSNYFQKKDTLELKIIENWLANKEEQTFENIWYVVKHHRELITKQKLSTNLRLALKCLF